MLKSISSSFKNELDTLCVLQQFTISKVAHSIDNVLPSNSGSVAAISISGLDPTRLFGICPNKSSRSSRSLDMSDDASHSSLAESYEAEAASPRSHCRWTRSVELASLKGSLNPALSQLCGPEMALPQLGHSLDR